MPRRLVRRDHVTEKHPTQEPVPLSGLITLTVLAPAVVPEAIAICAVSFPGFTNVTDPTVMPDPNFAIAPAAKFEPRMSTEIVAPLAPLFGDVEVGTGRGSIVRHPGHVPDPPPVVTVTSRPPVGAVPAALTLTVSFVPLTKVVETTVTPVPETEAVAPLWKLAPFTVSVRVPPCPRVLGLSDETVGAPVFPVIVKMPVPVLV